MTEQEIVTKLQGVFDSVFIDEVVVTRELSAHEVEEWDSLAQIALMVRIEKEFGVQFEMGVVSELENVGELVALLSSRPSN